MRLLVAACLGVAALSLLLPSAPSYDPWAWVVWGREVFELELDTEGGPSWKPGPVLITTLFAPLERIHASVPASLWLVVARAGGLLALALAFRLSRRLSGHAAAGAVAVLALVSMPLWLRYMLHGNEAPLAVALMLLAVERHLDGRRDHAALLLFAACLFRPEVLPFLAAEGVLVWRSEPGRRWLLVALGSALPLLWLLPEWIGAGNPLDGGRQASAEPPWSLSLQDRPWLAALGRAHDLAGLETELAALAGIAVAALRRQRATLVLAAIGMAWLTLLVVMTQLGFSGANRYFLAPLVVACLLAGAGAGAIVGAVAERASTRAAAAMAATLALLALPGLVDRSRGMADQFREAEETVIEQRELVEAVRRAGGRAGVLRYGRPRVFRGFHPRLAWELQLPMEALESRVGRGLVFRRQRGSGRSFARAR